MSHDVRRRQLLSSCMAMFAASAVLTACGGPSAESATGGTRSAPDASTDWAMVLSRANEEGQLTVWSTIQGTANAELKAAFAKEFPDIALTIVPLAATDLTQKVEGENAAGRVSADFLIQGDRAWHEKVTSSAYFAPIIGPDVKSADKNLRNGAASVDHGKTVGTQALYDADTLGVLGYSALGYAWNKDRVGKQPTFQSIFVGDEFKGRIGLIAPESTIINQYGYMIWLDRYPDLFKRLGKLRPTYYPTGQAMAQAMAAGAVDVGFPSILSVTAQLPNLGFAYDLPAPAFPRFGEILKSAPNPNAAQVFANWMLTTPAQETLVKVGGSLPVIPIGGGLSGADLHIYDAVASPEVEARVEEIRADLGR